MKGVRGVVEEGRLARDAHGCEQMIQLGEEQSERQCLSLLLVNHN